MAALAAIQAAGGGPAVLGHLESLRGPVEQWWSRRGPGSLEGLPRRLLVKLQSREVDGRVSRGFERLQELGFRAVVGSTLPALAALPEPPLVLYVRGRLPESGVPSLTVVGARRATGYGLRVTRRLARDVAAAGVPVISGLARGIDGAAHQGALEGEGVTVAILGAGPDRTYPPEHAELQRRIEETGAVVTEHLPGIPPKPHHFPRRNRLMVALASALLLVEARLKSGSLSSVRWAADLGREVLVLPGPVDSLLSEGPVTLLREGATPVATCAHVLEALGLDPEGPCPTEKGDAPQSSAPERRLLALLEGEPLDLDDIVRLSGDAPGHLLTLLLGLELRGLLVRDEAMRYRVATRAGPDRGARP